ncbi:HPr family phosphocarrier protein [Mycobacteroides abscessus]|uniref:HPr family phosphocarrier protein n=1 Tax=Mycobacteroides abscessus TaxID=36809 RepID=UPI00355B8575
MAAESAVGLHTRPAALISEAIRKSAVPVTLALAGGEPVDGSSALIIMTLGSQLRPQSNATTRRPLPPSLS